MGLPLRISAAELLEASHPVPEPVREAPIPKTRKVKIVRKDVVYRDRVLHDGENIEVETETAERWTWSGRAIPTPMIKVRLTQALFLGTCSHEAGEVLDVEEHTALHLYEHGAGIILDVGKIHGPLPAVKHPDVHKPFDPYAGIRLVKAIVKGSFVWGLRVFSRGDAIELPETKAIQALEHNAIELAAGETITPPPRDLSVIIPPCV